MNSSPIRFVVIGDATLDVIVRGAHPDPGRDRAAEITAGPGGQGANVAVRLARAGAAVTLVSSVASDGAGQILREALRQDGVTLLAAPAARTGLVVSLVDSTGDRAMLSDRSSIDVGVFTDADAAAALREAQWLHVSGYPLADVDQGAALARLAGSRSPGQRCSVGGGSFDPAHPGRAELVARLRAARPDLVHVDRAEAEAILGPGATGRESADGLAARLADALGGVAIVTDGAAGAGAATSEGSVLVAGADRPAADATGAGDAHAAAMLTILAPQSWPSSLAALRAALEAAGAQGAAVAGMVGAQARTASEVR